MKEAWSRIKSASMDQHPPMIIFCSFSLGPPSLNQLFDVPEAPSQRGLNHGSAIGLAGYWLQLRVRRAVYLTDSGAGR
jgi:hypothetical protein